MKPSQYQNRKSVSLSFAVATIAVLVAFSILLSGCATGRSAFKAGNYTEAAKVSADRLARSPNAEKASQVFLLSYPIARQEWLAKVGQAKADEQDSFRWERVASGYEVLRDLANRAALTPFANHEAIVIDYFNSEIAEAKGFAAKVREEVGDGFLNTGEMYDAREAFGHYSKAISYAGAIDRLVEKRDRARELGTLYVAIDPVSASGHGVNPGLLESALMSDLRAQTEHPFVRFLELDGSSNLQADYYVSLSVGELSLDRIDAEVGRTPFRRVIFEGREGERQREVGATLFRRQKKITANSPAQLSVFSRDGAEAVFQAQLDSSRSWVAHWDVVEGDARAIEGRELHLHEPADPEFEELAQLSVEGIVADTWNTLAGFFSNM